MTSALNLGLLQSGASYTAIWIFGYNEQTHVHCTGLWKVKQVLFEYFERESP